MSSNIKLSTVSIVRMLVGLLVKNCKWYFIVSILVCGTAGFGFSFTILLKQWFFESIDTSVAQSSITPSVIWGLVLGSVLVITLVFQGISDVLMDNLGTKLSGFLGKKINEKASRVDPVCFENTVMLNDINKAYQGVQGAATIIKAFVTSSAFFLPYFLFFIVYLYRIEPKLCAALLLIFIPALGGHSFRTRLYKKLEDNVAPIRRKKDYFEKCIVDREFAKETRLLGAVWFFRNLYETYLLLFQNAYWKTRRNSLLVELATRSIGLTTVIILLIIVYVNFQKGIINGATFVAIVTSLDQMFNYIDVLNFGFREVSSSLPSVHNAIGFLNLPERRGIKVDIKDYSITLKNVDYKYPNSSRLSLKNITLTIKNGETIAIVGENGAGKSTLVRMILGLYTPESGDVIIGGFNTKEIAIGSLMNNVSAVFQKYQRYKMTLYENIIISDRLKEIDDQRFEKCLQQADIQVADRSFNDGIDTMLSREFDGVDLSGGQWQRVAIGRGFYRDHRMIVLDEPTAAIDPVEETRVYRKFAEMSQGKTSIVVTHRLGSAKIAHKIVVMCKGEIDDVGTHEELMEKGGKYFEMFQAQAKWYA